MKVRARVGKFTFYLICGMVVGMTGLYTGTYTLVLIGGFLLGFSLSFLE